MNKEEIEQIEQIKINQTNGCLAKYVLALYQESLGAIIDWKSRDYKLKEKRK